VLCLGPPLAGVSTSVLHLAHVTQAKIERVAVARFRLDHVMSDGRTLSVQTDPRSPHYFEDSFDVRKRNPSLRPFVTEHLEFLESASAIIFVVDSQIERQEANRHHLQRLRRDLAGVGRSELEVPVVFQCNKRDLPNAATMARIAEWVSWPACEYVPSVALTGDGVVNAVKCAITAAHPASAQPYR
jgi:hypothetical protein